MKCPICGETMKKVSVPNPFGLARIDLFVCKHCKDGMYCGSRDLLDKFDMTAHALFVALQTLMSLREMEVSATVRDSLKEIKKIMLPGKEKKHAKKSN